MFLRNAAYLDEEFRLVKGDLEIDDGKILQVGEKLSYREEDMVVDCQGYTIVPGFVDIHIHGCAGTDACDGTREAVDNMARFLITKGVTSFCPTTMTVENDILEASLKSIRECVEQPLEDGARVVGINMEGPFIAEARKGAQRGEAIQAPDYQAFEGFFELSGGLVKLVDIAPEQPGGFEFIEKARELCTISVAHTTTDYEGAMKAFRLGASHVTHLFNAMNGISHRAPGVVGAALDSEHVTAEIICDGFHIHPAILRMTFRLLGDRAVIISDSMRANGLPEGEVFDLGGQMVTVHDGKATLDDGTIAGSVTNLHQEIKNLVSYGVPFEQAVKCATLVPARVLGLEEEIGSIKVGKRADLVILDENLEIVGVYH